MRSFDLTHPLGPGTAVYPGDPLVRFTPHATLEEAGFRVTELSLGTHSGTHLDAPSHFLSDGETVDALSLERLSGRAQVVTLENWRAKVAPGARLLFRSGWSEKWGREGYFEAFPGLSREVVDALAAAPVAMVGLETPSVHPDHATDAALHQLLLGAGVIIVENLRLPLDMPEEVFLAVLPLPLVGLDGSPCRAAAWAL